MENTVPTSWFIFGPFTNLPFGIGKPSILTLGYLFQSSISGYPCKFSGVHLFLNVLFDRNPPPPKKKGLQAIFVLFFLLNDLFKVELISTYDRYDDIYIYMYVIYLFRII